MFANRHGFVLSAILTFSYLGGAEAPGLAKANPLAVRGPFSPEACIDVLVSGGRLYTIGVGVLRVYDLTDPKNPKALGQLDGLGNTRQLEVAQGIAYIASREDGLFIADVRDPRHPTLLYHYDTLEKATGLAVAPPLAAVASRYHGVELIDISKPREPRYLATAIPTKEVQSVVFHEGLLYAGAWADRELLVVDTGNPYEPKLRCKVDLEGYGDGLAVGAGMVYAATGHHGRSFSKPHYAKPEAGDTGYGDGHGLDLFSIVPGAVPVRLSRVSFPKFYNGYPDMWGVALSKTFAAVNDTYSGVFLVSTADKSKPVILGQALLPVIAEKKSPDASASVAFGNGVLYIAGYFSGLYVADAPGVTANETAVPGSAAVASVKKETLFKDGPWSVYRPGGQVRGIALIGKGKAALATGNSGLHLVTLEPLQADHAIPTQDFALDVSFADGRLYVAEAGAGLSIWDLPPSGQPVLAGRYRPEKGSVQQVVALPGKAKVLVENGAYLFEVIDVSAPGKPVCLLSDKGPGLFYGKCITPGLVGGRYASVFWHMGGPVWYDMAEAIPRRLTQIPDVVGQVVSSMAVQGDRLLVLTGNGTAYTGPLETQALRNQPVYRLPSGEAMNGMAALSGSVLVTTSGAWKMVRAIDLSQPENPRLMEKMVIPGNPDRVVTSGDLVLIPAGHEGLRVARKPQWFAPAIRGDLAVGDLPAGLGAQRGTLSLGVKRCSDRFDFDEIPEVLLGLGVVSVARGQPDQPGAGYQFSVNQRVTAYLFVMDPSAPPPDGWVKTPLRAKWNYQKQYFFTDTIFQKDFEAGMVRVPENGGKVGVNYGAPHLVALKVR